LDGSTGTTVSAAEGKKGAAVSGDVSVDASGEVSTDGNSFDAETEGEADFTGVDFGSL